jgi:hypothetical protein
LHGSAVGHIRETAWLANNFFAHRAGQPIADQPFRDWAFSLGGPIIIPKVYNGRNKTFFFASDESYRQQDGSTTVLAVPAALERAGNFSQSFTRSGALQTVYDPNSTNLATGARTPYPNNIIPASQLSPIGTRSRLTILYRMWRPPATPRRIMLSRGPIPIAEIRGSSSWTTSSPHGSGLRGPTFIRRRLKRIRL